MKKRTRISRKEQEKRLNRIIIGVLIATAILLIVLVIIRQPANDQSSLIITEDGHVHTADGTHLGMYDELFGDAAATTDDPAATDVVETTTDPAAAAETDIPADSTETGTN